MVYFLSHFAL